MDPLLPRTQQDHNHGNVFVIQPHTVAINTVSLQMDHMIHLITHMIRRKGFMLHENFVSISSWSIEGHHAIMKVSC